MLNNKDTIEYAIQNCALCNSKANLIEAVHQGCNTVGGYYISCTKCGNKSGCKLLIEHGLNTIDETVKDWNRINNRFLPS